MWYNEEDLAPFFLNHFAWVDRINLIVDRDTNDSTVEISKNYQNVDISYICFPDGMDDLIKADALNEKYKSIKADWVIVLDADEFIFNSELGNDLSRELKELRSGKIIFSRLWNVYRHSSEEDLVVGNPISSQRKYGISNMKGQISTYTKPSILKGGLDARLTPGNHSVIVGGNEVQPKYILEGAHWAMADETIAIKRRIHGRKMRQSAVNLSNQLSAQHHNITEDDIRAECSSMMQCPQVLFPNP